MHSDRTDQITVSREPAFLAVPNPAFGFVFMPTSGTLATCSSFGASEAQDVGLFRFVGKIVDVFAIFPAGHALIVVSAIVAIAHAMRIADEERSHLMLHTEVDEPSASLMAHVTNAPFRTEARLVLGALQFLPAAGILRAAGLLLGNLAEAHNSLAFEGTDTTPRDDHGLTRVGGDGGKMNFAQINSGLVLPRSIFCLRYLDADMQLKAILPDKATCTAICRKFDGQHNGFAAFAHGQHHTPMLFRDGLSRPLDRIEAFGPPRVFHLHVRMGLAKFTGRNDIGKKGMNHHLHRLAMQGKLALGGLLQLIASRPLAMLLASLFMQLHTQVPHLCCFHLSGLDV